ncbi:MAG: helix-turn-helix transcriptional regulator [Geodermatophilaceae bacterium]|nr:helix-turn-helix transcriptional regulator [Geodermatophilaceae bacterium]
MRTALGRRLRSHREGQRRTLRDVSGSARVSLGYLSEVERGQKEASSELLSCICDALDLELADLLSETSDDLRTPADTSGLMPADLLSETPVLKAVDSLIAA